MQFNVAVFVVVCVLAVVGCDDELTELEPVDLEPEADAGQLVERPAPDASSPELERPTPDASSPELADASQTPAPVVDAGLPVPPVVEPPAPVADPPRCALVFYADRDRDGFGDPATALVSCARPDGYVDNAADCFDGNKLAKPGQTGRFSEHRGDGSFDYDCDGMARVQSDQLATCPEFTEIENNCRPPQEKYMVGDPVQLDDCYLGIMAKTSPLREGWWMVVPGCGETGLTSYFTPWSRETGYTCVARGANTYSYQTCN